MFSSARLLRLLTRSADSRNKEIPRQHIQQGNKCPLPAAPDKVNVLLRNLATHCHVKLESLRQQRNSKESPLASTSEPILIHTTGKVHENLDPVC